MTIPPDQRQNVLASGFETRTKSGTLLAISEDICAALRKLRELPRAALVTRASDGAVCAHVALPRGRAGAA